MGKRDASQDEDDLAVSTSDDHDSRGSPSGSNKRPRLASPLPGSSPPPLPASGGDDEFDPDRDGDEQSGDDDDVMDDEDEEERRRQREELDAFARTQTKKGNVAQSGVIETVTLHNFMCHTYCEIAFGPQINFLVGHNGSGKSAVLTGISMALGGNAKATNRSSKGGGLVKDGQQFAICKVKIKNAGIDAYRPKEFGPHIIIERRINRDMGGGYKIKNHLDKTLDTRKATLDAIMDHFNIQVDNPMTVLTQDQSRQFLANSSAKDKYNFFLRGTQLAQLTEEYEVLRANTESMQASLEKKKTVIPELKEAYKRAKIRFQEAESAEGQKDKVTTLEHQLAWAYVAEVESKMKESQDYIAKQQRVADKIEKSLEEFKTNETAANEMVANLNEAMAEASGTTDGSEAELEKLNASIQTLKNTMKKFSDDERVADRDRKRVEAAIKSDQQALAAEREKIKRIAARDRQPIIDRIQQLQEEQSALQARHLEEQNSAATLDEERRALDDPYHAAQANMDGAQNTIRQIQERVETAKRSRGNELLRYGPDMPKLVNALSTTQWTKRPMGPIGTFVKMRDHRYSKTLEAVFGRLLGAFVVDNERDKNQLARLFRQFNIKEPIIKVQFDPTFDCSSGEPDPKILTVRRNLEIANPLIDQVLVTNLHIEKAALVPQRVQGDELMRSNPYNVETCFSADGFRLGVGTTGGSYTSAIEDWKGSTRLDRDVSAHIASLEKEIEHHRRELEGFKAEFDNLNRQKTDLFRREKKHQTDASTAARQANKLGNEITKLNEQLADEEPSNIASLEEIVKLAQENLASIVAQFDALSKSKRESHEQLQPLYARKEEIDKANKSAQDKRRKIQTKLEDETTKLHEARNAVNQYQKKLADKVEEIKKFDEELIKLQERLDLSIEQASAVVAERPQIDKKKTIAKLQKDIEQLKKLVRDRERQQGATFAEIAQQLAERRKAAEDAIAVTNELHNFIAVLAAAYSARLNRWTDFRDAIASRAKMQFIYHLSNRGFTGKLSFDHEKNRLNLRVQTDDASVHGKSKYRQKDAKSLSGGEKSFSTICLLLTMWEAVGCPLRCLDEFDVFMDAVNRRISMKMMVDTAKTADATQFILITPQAMTEVKYGPEVRVSRMVDPGRNQGTLAFNR